MREAFKDVREGMPVYDSADQKVGTVRDIYLGSEAGAVGESARQPSPHSFIDDIAAALAPAPLPDVVQARLRREGFIRIDVSGPFASDRYAFASQIRSVSAHGVQLDSLGDDLLRR